MQTCPPEKIRVLGVIGVPEMLGASNYVAFRDGTQAKIDRNTGANEHLLCSSVSVARLPSPVAALMAPSNRAREE